MLVLIPEVNKDTLGIDLLEFIWKVVDVVIDTRIKIVVQLHDFFHGLCAGRGAGTIIVDLKIVKKLESVNKDPLFLVLLYLSNSYDNPYRGRILQTLSGYRSGPKLQGLMAEFWLHQTGVTCQNGFHGPQFRVTRGKTWGVMVLT